MRYLIDQLDTSDLLMELAKRDGVTLQTRRLSNRVKVSVWIDTPKQSVQTESRSRVVHPFCRMKSQSRT